MIDRLSGQMKHFWNLVTGDLVEADDEHLIALLLADGYVEVSGDRFAVLADVGLGKNQEGGHDG